MNKMILCIWLDNQAEEAAAFYCSVFKDAKMGRTVKYPAVGQEIHGGAPGSVMTVEFEANGLNFMLLNGGPLFKPNEALSVIIYCDTQEEIDYYWEKLSAVPEAEQCGWLKDKYGISWQVTPPILDELIASEDEAVSGRVMAAMLKMHKISIAEIEAAAKG